MARAAIVILNYNGAGYLRQFLPTLLRHSGEADIVVGDNASDDNSLELLQKEFPAVHTLTLGANYGYAGGYNRLIERLDYDYLALVNSDIEVTSGWLPPLLQMLEDHPGVAAVQPKIRSLQDRHLFEYAGAAGGYLDRYGYPFCRGRLFDTLEEDQGQYDDDRPVFWASGACLVIRRTAFLEVGGFDEQFFAHFEEIDLCWRLQRAGHTVMYCGASTVFHLGGGTLGYSSPRKVYLNYRNNWLTLIKNLPRGRLYTDLPLRLWLDGLSALYYLLTGHMRAALAVHRAHLYLLLHLRQAMRSRRQITYGFATFVQPAGYSVVWQYFIKKKRRYSDLIPDRVPPAQMPADVHDKSQRQIDDNR